MIGAITEGLDAVGALWKALPNDAKTGYYKLHYRDKKTGEIKTYYKRRHRASTLDKISDLSKGFYKLDVQQGLSNLVDEAIEDRIFGGIGQQIGKARGRLNVDVNREFNKQRAQYGRRARGIVNRREGENWVDFGPNGRSAQFGPAL